MKTFKIFITVGRLKKQCLLAEWKKVTVSQTDPPSSFGSSKNSCSLSHSCPGLCCPKEETEKLSNTTMEEWLLCTLYNLVPSSPVIHSGGSQPVDTSLEHCQYEMFKVLHLALVWFILYMNIVDLQDGAGTADTSDDLIDLITSHLLLVISLLHMGLFVF